MQQLDSSALELLKRKQNESDHALSDPLVGKISESAALEIRLEKICRCGIAEGLSGMKITGRLLDAVLEKRPLMTDPLPEKAREIPLLALGMRLKAAGNLFSSERVAFVENVIKATVSEGTLSPDMATAAGGLFLLLPKKEKTSVAGKLASYLEHPYFEKPAASLLKILLGSVQNPGELSSLVNCLEPLNPAQSKYPFLRESVALIAVRKVIIKAPSPRLLKKSASPAAVRRKLSEIRDCLKQRLEFCKKERGSFCTQAYKRFTAALKENLHYLDSVLSEGGKTREKRNLANTIIRKMRIESRYNLVLSAESDKKGFPVCRWSEKDMRDITEVLRRIPDGMILFARRLSQIRLVREIEEGTYGIRQGTGLIRLSKRSVSNRDISAEFRGISSLKIVLCHELAHSLELGPWGAGSGGKDRIGDLAAETDPRFDFNTFAALSGWEVIESRRHKIKNGGQSVVIDGTLHLPLDRPVKLFGEDVVLQYEAGERILYKYRYNAEFPLNSYARSDPWEDFAESMAEYMFLPDRLIEFAPLKFTFFENIFCRYRNNNDLQETLHGKLHGPSRRLVKAA